MKRMVINFPRRKVQVSSWANSKDYLGKSCANPPGEYNIMLTETLFKHTTESILMVVARERHQ